MWRALKQGALFMFVVGVLFGVLQMICDSNNEPLAADIKFYSDGVRVINSGGPLWEDVKMEVNGVYRARVAARIDSGKANFVRFDELATGAGLRFNPLLKINTVTVSAMAPKFRVKAFIVE